MTAFDLYGALTSFAAIVGPALLLAIGVGTFVALRRIGAGVDS